MKQIINWENKYITVVMWLAIIIYPFLFIWQGLNFSDEGSALTIYHSIFTNPQSVGDTFGTWGTNIIGGAWLSLFGNFGVIGVRFAGALVSILTIIFAYLILKEYIEKKILLLGILVSFLFSYHFFTLTIMGYTNLSILFFVISIFFLAKGLKKNNNLLLFIAGFILSFNIFVRLPNILGLLFILGISLNAYIKKDIPVKTYLKQHFAFILGVLLNFVAVYFTMKFFGHITYYIESLRYTMGSVQMNQGAYNGLIAKTLKGYNRFFVDATSMLVLFFLAIFLYLYTKFDRLNIFIKSSLLILFLLLLYAQYNLIGVPIGGRVATLLIGMCYLALAMRIFNYKDDKNLSIIAFLILTLFIIIPIGSGAGYINSFYIMPIVFPMVVSYIHNAKKINFSLGISQPKIFQNISFTINEETLKKIKDFLLVGFILYALTNAFAFSYDDSYNRFRLNTGINSPYLKGIYTTKEKAEPLSELLSELPKYVHKGDTILVAWIAPIIYYLSETHPYFPHPWTEIYTREQVIEFLNNNQKNTKLPVVVRYNYLKPHLYDDILYRFFKNNSYKKKWNNDVYEIYAPSSL